MGQKMANKIIMFEKLQYEIDQQAEGKHCSSGMRKAIMKLIVKVTQRKAFRPKKEEGTK